MLLGTTVLVSLLSLAVPDVLVVDDAGFRLTAPGAEWTLLDREAVQSIQPRAAAGMHDGSGLYGVVVVEPAPSESVAALGRRLAESGQLEDSRVDFFEDQRFRGHHAVRWMVTGTARGTRWRHHFVLFEARGSLYRLVAWAPAEGTAADGSSFQPFLDSFSWLEGMTEVGAPEQAIAEGVGWRQTEESWHSAARAMEIRPEGEWRIATADELARWSVPSAEVGLVHDGMGARLAIVFGRLDPSYHAAWAKGVHTEVTGQSEPRNDAMLVKVDDVEVELQVHAAQARAALDDGAVAALRVVTGSLSWGERCAAFLGWYPATFETRALVELRLAFAFLRTLGDVEREQLAEELLRGAPEPNLVGDGYSLRDGIYRDFRVGLSWARPDRGWAVSAGEEAARQRPDAILAFHHPELGLRGLVVPTPAQPISPDEAHGDVVTALCRGARARLASERETLALGDATALVSTLDTLSSGNAGAPTRRLVATTENSGWTFQIHVWGAREMVTRHPDVVQAAIRGFRIDASPKAPTFVSAVGYYDDRMGFQLRSPGPDWVFDESRESELWPLGSVASWENGRDLVGALALHGAELELGDAFHASLLKNGLPDHVAGWLAGTPEAASDTFDGREARRLTWDREDGRRSTAWLFERFETLHAVVVSEASPARTRADAEALFELLH